jgi:deoxyribodipyrimidine photo-lyase
MLGYARREKAAFALQGLRGLRTALRLEEEVGAGLGRSAFLQRTMPPRTDRTPMKEPVQLVWFKRDLRADDHRPLAQAARRGPVLGLYLYEPDLHGSEEFTAAHVVFLNESLRSLQNSLRELGGELVLRRGEAVSVMHALRREMPLAAVWSHEETGSDRTYRRDREVAAWCREQGIPWHEFRQDGVVRRLRSRQGWSGRWEKFMREPATPRPVLRGVQGVRSDGILSPADLGLAASDKPEAQKGGAEEAQRTVTSFLTERGANYRAAMSSPVEGWTACSRISPYLSFGCLSLRAVADQLAARRAALRQAEAAGALVDRRWFGSLQSFGSRLRWHCHFMQKLEDEPRIEFQNFVRAYDGLREEFTASPEGRRRFEAWKEGLTGYPMVDACIRCVKATGWLNFRMRAMLASFSAYHLWLHWREPAVWLGSHFLDFEAGIHFSQFQMQSGTSGINTVRIYSPAKQAAEQDPEGEFIRRWVPELRDVPVSWLPRPEQMPAELQGRSGCVIGRDYPAPIVEHAAAVRSARERIAAVRRRTTTRAEAQAVFVRHGSRKKSARRGVRKNKQPTLPGLGEAKGTEVAGERL